LCLPQISSALVRLTLRATCLTILPTMISLLLHMILAGLKTRHRLAMENLALRHQIQVLQRPGKRPRLTRADRGLWVLLSRIWRDWRDGLFVIKPDTVVRWHRMGFKLYWRWKSRKRKTGRPRVSLELMALIRKISLANPLWGAPRIHGELLKLRIDLAQSTISKYMAVRGGRPLRRGRPFSGITRQKRSPSTSSQCPRRRSGSSTFSSRFPTNGGE